MDFSLTGNFVRKIARKAALASFAGFFLLGILGRSKVWIQGVSAFIIVLLSYVIFYILLDPKLSDFCIFGE